jgi:hypothetical protein
LKANTPKPCKALILKYFTCLETSVFGQTKTPLESQRR